MVQVHYVERWGAECVCPTASTNATLLFDNTAGFADTYMTFRVWPFLNKSLSACIFPQDKSALTRRTKLLAKPFQQRCDSIHAITLHAHEPQWKYIHVKTHFHAYLSTEENSLQGFFALVTKLKVISAVVYFLNVSLSQFWAMLYKGFLKIFLLIQHDRFAPV